MQRIQTFVDDEIYEEFKEEAERKNMTLSEYARDILMKRAAVEVVIDFEDIDSYNAVSETTILKESLNPIKRKHSRGVNFLILPL